MEEIYNQVYARKGKTKKLSFMLAFLLQCCDSFNFYDIFYKFIINIHLANAKIRLVKL